MTSHAPGCHRQVALHLFPPTSCSSYRPKMASCIACPALNMHVVRLCTVVMGRSVRSPHPPAAASHSLSTDGQEDDNTDSQPWEAWLAPPPPCSLFIHQERYAEKSNPCADQSGAPHLNKTVSRLFLQEEMPASYHLATMASSANFLSPLVQEM